MAVPRGPTLRQWGLVALALYVIAGVVYSCMLPATARFSDEREYLALTDHLLHGPGFSMDGEHLTAFRPPGYSFLLAAVEAVGGGIVAARILQFGLLAATILLLARLIPAQNRDAATLLTTLVVALYPLYFYTSSTLYPQTLAGFLFVLALTLLLRESRSWLTTILAGIVYGYLILVVPTFLLTLFILLGVAWLLKLVRWHDGVIIAVVAAFVVLLWTARNYAEFRQFVPVASYSGAQFLIGNCENTIPYGGSGNIDTTVYHDYVAAHGLDEFQADRYYRQVAVTWIEQHPTRAFVLYLEKAANFFNVYNEYAPESRGEVTPWKQAVLGFCYGLLLAGVVWRLCEMKRFPLSKTEKLFLAVFVLSAFTQAIFYTRIRLRLPYDFLLVYIVAAHLARQVGKWSQASARAAREARA